MIYIEIDTEEWSFEIGVEIFQFTNSRGADEHTQYYEDFEFTGEYECNEVYNVRQDKSYNDTVTLERVVNLLWDDITDKASTKL